MKLQHFQEVVAIAGQGSIRAAARHLDISQPALTRSLADLERELGAPLFQRVARGVVATPLGEVFIGRAASILQEVRRTQDEVQQMRGMMTGTVSAGLSIAAHLALLPATLRPFQKRFPQVTLHVIEGLFPTLEAGLRDGSVDFYIGPDPAGTLPPGLSRAVLGASRRTVLCRVGHPLATATSLRELGGARWATTSITAAARDEMGVLFERHGLPPPQLAFRSQSALTLITCLSHSDLLAMAPVQWSAFPLTRSVLTTIPVREELAAAPLVTIRRADLPLTPAATHLLDLMLRAQAAKA